ncbi:hypothetical protein K2173_015713 [Erythroxylum novogranatense]|uniref:SOSEKI DIX-like domain-containing protein n=1 Tax=Erythroxylum novogranatense TaxID=1862640 RepID=A0AAV8SEU4_9ROSI|nr:hypothetical protein K2173_015713 [Erythroxylum novogranatense]
MGEMEASFNRGSNAKFHVSREWAQQKDRDATPERTRIWSQPSSHKLYINNGVSQRKLPVVYYLSTNGQLEHPHFMEVPLSSTDGLFLKDVINRLNVLRGKGMASLYSWSAKRNYKNGFVWHDLAENDLIHPTQGNEYVLKGSKLLDDSITPIQNLLESTPSSRSLNPPEARKQSTGDDSEFPVIFRRRNQSWSSIDLNEYKVYKAEPGSESDRKLAADASTQTDDKRRRRRLAKKEEIEEVKGEQNRESELIREEIDISPPPSDSSPETLESLMKAGGRLVLNHAGSGNEDSSKRTLESCGRMKASTVLMQLISCGSISFRDCGATAVKEQQGLSLTGHYKGRLPRGGGGGGNCVGTGREITNFSGVSLEDKEYFSGSLVETKKDEIQTLKRSNSYHEDRQSSRFQTQENESEGTGTKCIPRKTKTIPNKKVINADGTSGMGSKRFDFS